MNDYADLKDEQLLSLVLNGDDEAQNAFYNRYKPLVIVLSRRFFLKGANYEDLIQEGMIGLFKGVRSFDPSKGDLKSFLIGCIKNQLNDAVKAAGRIKHSFLNDYVSFTSLPDEDAENIPGNLLSNELNPEELFILKESNVDFYQEFSGKLKLEELEILKLYLEGNSYSEISSATKTTIKYIDNTLQKVKKLAKKIYE